jgi:hypothetical protein
MKFIAALFLCLCSTFAHAGHERYANIIWVYTHDYVYFFQSCWTVVEQSDYLGNYCYGEYYSWGVPSPAQSDVQYEPMELVIFSAPHGSAYFVDKSGDCFLLNKIDHPGDDETRYSEYFVQCGDYIFNDGFEDHSVNPPGE